MSSQFQQIINLIQKTGDRCIVTNPGSDTAYVVMSLSEYKKLIERLDEEGPGILAKEINKLQNLTEEELLDKINREIAIWKSGQEETQGGFLDNNIQNSDNESNKSNKGPSISLKDIEKENIEAEKDKFYLEEVVL